MKHFNHIKKILIGTLVAVFLVACNKSGGGGSGAAPYNPNNPWGGNPQNCVNCFGGGAPLLVGVKTQTNNGNLQGMLDIIGDQSRGYNFADPRVVSSYMGPVQIVGTLTVQQPGDWYLCGATPGVYQLRTMDQGLMQLGVTSPLRIEAVSNTGGQMILRVAQGILRNESGSGLDRNSPDNRISMAIYLERVNGQPCYDIQTL
jgi:hypothetical protein